MLKIKKKVILVPLLLFLSFFAETKNTTRFDYFKFDLAWPNSFCNQGIKPNCKEPIPQDFIVHGLWPYKANGRHAPRKISTHLSFSKTEVAKWNFSHNLSIIWPNLKNGMAEVQFWELEWNRHGIYTGLKPEEYFSLGLEFANKYNYLLHFLLKSGVVVTHSGQFYQRDVLHDEITKLVGSKPMITCNRYKSTIQFFSICICINIKGVALNCSQRFRKCGEGKELLLFPMEETGSFLVDKKIQ